MVGGWRVPEVDGYDDLVEIAQGGFSVVYRAHQARFDRTVALKVLDRRALEGSSVDRFERECRAMGKLSWHPNVVAVHDSGVTAGGEPYLAMEYLPDGSLDDRLVRAGPLPWTAAVEVAIEVAGALEVAHGAGILHRDLKPANLLVGAYGATKLADFGIAGVGTGVQTTVGSRSMTLAFASPEVLEGRPATSRSDLFSLAATVHALVSGRPPFDREGDQSEGVLILRVIQSDPADLRVLDVPDDLIDAIEWAMTKDSDRRPASAREFGERLQEIQRAHGLAPTALRADRHVLPPSDVVDAASLPSGDLDEDASRETEIKGLETVLRAEALPSVPGQEDGDSDDVGSAPVQSEGTSGAPAWLTAPRVGVGVGVLVLVVALFAFVGPGGGETATTTSTPPDTSSTVTTDARSSGGISAAVRAAVQRQQRSSLEVAVYDASGSEGVGQETAEGLVRLGYTQAGGLGAASSVTSRTSILYAAGCATEAQSLVAAMDLTFEPIMNEAGSSYDGNDGVTIFAADDLDGWGDSVPAPTTPTSVGESAPSAQESSPSTTTPATDSCGV